jgi:hypothetical protein
METNPFDAGKAEATEVIVALIYDRYIYHRTFHGRDSDLALSHKLLIQTIRDQQAREMGVYDEE